MNAEVIKISNKKGPLSVVEITMKIRSECENIINFSTQEREGITFLKFESELWKQLSYMGIMYSQLFLMSCHESLNYSKWLDTGLYYVRKTLISKTIKTVFGKVTYYRTYLVRKDNNKKVGFYPLDTILGLTRDGFSPSVISLATRLATRVSFLTTVKIFGYFYGWSPSAESVETLVLGLGRQAGEYMEIVKAPEGDGEVLIIEADGKATPTATDEELEKRRKKRKKKKGCCQRHRGKEKRKGKKRKRRKKGDKSKNGRSITIVVMYTLRKGTDGLLHGPVNKIVWASYAPRRVILEWARRQATKRGFPLGTGKRIHIAIDGEACLKKGLAELFPEATFALDIIHVEEKLWKIGRAYYGEGSEETEEWVEEMKSLLYGGCVKALLF